VLLLVGNDAWKKGTDVAVGALAVLPGGTVLAAGGLIDGAEVRQVRSRSDPLVHAADPCKYYAATDVLVASSREDSSYLPAIEAMATGLPVVVSARAVVSELVEEGGHALVLPDAQDVEEVDSTIKRALNEELAPAIRGERPRARRSLDLGRQHRPHR
jgi:glycosyltransferase involved in cell wall biosynthesis